MIYGELKISMEINEYIKQYKEKGGYIKALREHIGHAPIITIGVGVIVENSDGEILLQKRKDNGKWAIIGGGMEIGESFEEVIRREAREETGIELGELRLLALCNGADRFITYPNGDIVYSSSSLHKEICVICVASVLLFFGFITSLDHANLYRTQSVLKMYSRLQTASQLVSPICTH